jgi:alanine dehydrogenase
VGSFSCSIQMKIIARCTMPSGFVPLKGLLMELLLLNAEEVRSALTMDRAIEAVTEAYIQLSTGKSQVPLRSRINFPNVEGVALFMPALLEGSQDLGVKIVTVFPRNAKRELPTIHALVVVLDPITGQPLALLEGASLTAIRTGAASGTATKWLARPDAKLAAIFGSGAQARTQLEAICTVRDIEHAWIYSLDQESAEEMIADLAGSGSIPPALELASSPHQAVCDADVICTATTSMQPVFHASDLKPGVHINAIGSFTPEMQEIGSDTMKQAYIVLDSHDAVLSESGDVLIPLAAGLITEADLQVELGQIAAGLKPGRSSDSQITLFKSVGVAVQDAIAASRAVQGALEAGLGRTIVL